MKAPFKTRLHTEYICTLAGREKGYLCSRGMWWLGLFTSPNQLSYLAVDCVAMASNILRGYLSRSQVRNYLSYILENGVDDIKEAPDSTYASDAMSKVVGAGINSIKMFHVQRFFDDKVKLKALSYALISNDIKPEKPEGTYTTGILYLSKTKEYSGLPDTFSGSEITGDAGDALWLTNDQWNSLVLGKTAEGVNHRLFIFWGVSY